MQMRSYNVRTFRWIHWC